MNKQVFWLKTFWVGTGILWGLMILAGTYCIGIWISESIINLILKGV
jgi:hypothetical protein